ncbi:PP2C family protein-serine/threonine phosphatase [Planobispora siamensis]|nr:GAF domain-containing SpoIIE family protein phosphatase [Planobispora siamensis]
MVKAHVDGMSVISGDEVRRLAAVRRYQILDTPPDGAFDRVAALAARAFDVPMATVTIVDEDRIWFKAQRGLPAGMNQIRREPGLCASAILCGEPYVVTDARTDPRTMDNSLVDGPAGIRFYAAAPIITSDGYRLGTVNVLDVRPRTVDAAQLATLQDLAALVADELEVRLAAMATVARERRMRRELEREQERLELLSSTLQRTLLPSILPDVPGLELAAYYHVASSDRVGGDFYDVFALGDGRWGLFLGDVSGKGAEAAALTSLARYTLRAAATYDPDPVGVLHNLNTVLLQEQQPGDPRYCTVQFGLLTPDGPGFDLVLAAGGHPPAQVVRAGGEVEALHPADGCVVGVFDDPTITTVRTRLNPGDALLLHSDGLTEARTPDGHLFGEERLRGLLAPLAGRAAKEIVTVMRGLLADFGAGLADDTAILALSVP